MSEKTEREIVIAGDKTKVGKKRYTVPPLKLLTWWWWPYAGQEFLHYAKNVNPDMAKEAKKELNKWSWIWLLVGAAFWLITLNVDNWLKNEPTYLPHWAIFLILTYCTGTTIINFHFVWPKNRFATPNYTSLLKKDEGIDSSRVLLPDRSRFVLGYDGIAPVFATMNTKSYGSTCRWMLYGQDDRWGKEELPYTFIKGAFANDCLCIVLDCDAGCDFSPLRYKQFARLYSDEFKTKYGKEKWDFVLQMSAMPYMVVRSSVEDNREINDALLWLDRELERRQNERASIPGANWPFILVVLDTKLTEYYFGKKPDYEHLTALERLAFGKALNTGVVALADSSRQWGEGSYQDCFDSIEFRHRVIAKGKDENKQFTVRNVVEAAAFTVKLWERGESREIKLVKTELPELGKWILDKGATFSKQTYDLYLACLNSKLYVESKEPEPVELPKEREIKIGSTKIKEIRQGDHWFTPKSEQKKLKEVAQ